MRLRDQDLIAEWLRTHQPKKEESLAEQREHRNGQLERGLTALTEGKPNRRDKIAEIVRMTLEDMTQPEIARKLGISEITPALLMRRKTSL